MRKLLCTALWTVLFMAVTAAVLAALCGNYFVSRGPPHGFGTPDYPIREMGQLWKTVPFAGGAVGLVLGLLGLLPGTGAK